MVDTQQLVKQGLSYFESQKYKELITYLKPHHQKHPMLSMLYAIALGKEKAFTESFLILSNLHRKFPNNLDVIHNHGLLLKESGQLEEALYKHKDALKINPSYLPAHLAIGNIFSNLGQNKQAADSYGHCFKIKQTANNFELLLRAHLANKDFSSCIDLVMAYPNYCSDETVAVHFAEACYRSHNRLLLRQHYTKLSKQHPSSCYLHFYASMSEIEAKRYIFAEQILNKASYLCEEPAIQTEIRANLLYLAWLRSGQDDEFTALVEYLKECDTDFSKLFLFNVYDGLGMNQLATQALDSCSKEHQKSIDGQYQRAKLMFKTKMFEDAKHICLAIFETNQDHLGALYLYAKTQEQLGNIESVCDTFQKIASMSSQDPKLLSGSDKANLGLQNFNLPIAKPLNRSSNATKFIFIVGFPRSGTTLLENELMKSSNLTLLEETDCCASFYQELTASKSFDTWESFAASATTEELNQIAEQFLFFLSTFVDTKKGNNIYLDKMPLNIPYLPLMLSLFPNSKVICCVRDPRDVAISCFKFEEVNIHTIEQFASAYDAVFTYADAVSNELKDSWTTVRYEDLVENIDLTMTKLFDSLELKRDDIINNTRLIQTPSYYQVSEPIYNTSVELYKSYLPFIELSHELIEKWIKTLNYD